MVADNYLMSNDFWPRRRSELLDRLRSASYNQHTMFGSIGMPELIVIFLVALLFFGPRKLPELGRSLGKSLGEFKRATRELRSTLEEEIDVEERQARPAPAPPQAARSDDASYARGADPGA
jgi:TatA/E family protein of Tat protein translocase